MNNNINDHAVEAVPLGSSNHQHVLQLVQLVGQHLKFYQSMKVEYHSNGQVKSLEIGWDTGAAVVAGIATAGVILLLIANPVVIATFVELVTYCVLQYGETAVIGCIGASAVSEALKKQ